MQRKHRYRRISINISINKDKLTNRRKDGRAHGLEDKPDRRTKKKTDRKTEGRIEKTRFKLDSSAPIRHAACTSPTRKC